MPTTRLFLRSYGVSPGANYTVVHARLGGTDKNLTWSDPPRHGFADLGKFVAGGAQSFEENTTA